MISPPDTARLLAGEAILQGYSRMFRIRLFVSLALALALCAAFALDLLSGPSSLGVGEAISALLGEEASRTTLVILTEVRLPTAITAVLVGMALSVAGAEMQTVLDNPLASPFTLGVSSAASLGAALAIVLGFRLPGLPDGWMVSGNAFVFAFGSMLLLNALARRAGSGTQTLVLLGIALFFTFNALTSLLQFLASQQALQQIVFWTLGSLAQPSWAEIRLLAILLALVLPFSLMASWRMTALRLGEDRALSFGVDVARLRFAALMRISLLAAAAVAVAGTISFVGLVGPHVARLIIGEDHRFFLPVSALSGALMMSLASFASKSILPGVLIPVGIVTALVGLPFFFTLILSRKA